MPAADARHAYVTRLAQLTAMLGHAHNAVAILQDRIEELTAQIETTRQEMDRCPPR